MFRYAVIYTFGGVYADVDTDCITPISSWNITDCDLLVGLENDLHFCQWAFAATARSPFMKAIIEAIVGKFESHDGVDTSNPNFVHYHTGPAIFSQSLKESFAKILGFQNVSLSWDSRKWFNALQNRTYTAPYRICVRDYAFFNFEHVRNNYASSAEYQNWTSWTKEAHRLSAESNPKQET